ncbi:Segregation and condensation protein A [Anatilimnocola aggregata]|uniref:Segregation and condensation protein A n=1 Tax=Anatilimnocola aggregata TaxID=2528021 RepID=A0A517YLJ0_9BACT|nr:segregation/condensation protein A [Anatilimnocola aggregata]QDU31073.1 Segregation and condensation protein A [Anatilimnocola aggregata]
MDFRVDLTTFRGPLDLLLYLVRKQEVDLADLPIALITEQYLQYLELLEHLDVNSVADFLEMASTLIEIKSREVLPHGGEEVETFDDPRENLVQKLLEYKQIKDAASMLEERGRDWQRHVSRLASDLPPREIAPADQPIHEVELWDLVSAMGRILREKKAVKQATITYDETPIQVYMKRIHEKLTSQQRAAFSEMFAPGMHKSAMIGVFLAVLELVRHHSVRAEQNDLHGEIWIVPDAEFDPAKEIVAIDNYDARPISDDMPVQGR